MNTFREAFMDELAKMGGPLPLRKPKPISKVYSGDQEIRQQQRAAEMRAKGVGGELHRKDMFAMPGLPRSQV